MKSITGSSPENEWAIEPTGSRGYAMGRMIRAAGLATFTLLCAGPVSAHSGGLDKHGCHTNRSTGDYHCHRGGAPSAATLAPGQGAGFRERTPMWPAPAGQASGAFANCAEAKAAGAAPVRRGEPGYGPHLDRDNDGIGCEPYRGR